MKPSRTPEATSYDEADLLRRARAAKQRAYAPYSHFHVGCVVLTDDGDVFEGANVENAAYALSACAEATAIRSMAAAGVRSPVIAVAVVGDGRDPCTPCGACRQIIFEFGTEAMVYASGAAGRPLVASIKELLAHPYGPRRLAQGQT